MRAIALLSVLPLAGCIASAPGSGGGGGGSNPTTTITISPSSVAVSLAPPGNSVTFTYTATSNVTGVVWYLNGAVGGPTTPQGTLSQQGVYTAPATEPSSNTVTVYAEDAAASNSTQSNTATITLNPAVSVSVSPTPTFLPVDGVSQTLTATVSGVPSGGNQGVSWSVSPSGFGTITALSANTATYTAPTALPATWTSGPYPVTITANSVADSTRYGTATINVHVQVVIGNAPSTVGVGSNWQYTAQVNGLSSGQDQSVKWATSIQTAPNCTDGAGSFPFNLSDPDPVGLYFAPSCVPGGSIAIKATSNFDPTVNPSTTLTTQANDPVGTASPATAAGATIDCPANIGGTSGASCYQLDVSCPGIADWPDTYLKVNQPAGTPLGTVILATGQGSGNALYDNDPDFINGSFNGGLTVVDGLLNSSVPNQGYTTVQVSFGAPFNNSSNVQNGWLTGPGGVRHLACRFATVAQWVYANIANSTAPLCATGNSGGAGAIGYALTEYGQDSIFKMVEATSGPPMSRLDQGCSSLAACQTQAFTCNGIQAPSQMCFSVDEAEIIDPAYATATQCSGAVSGSSTPPDFLFGSDSILWGLAPIPAGAAPGQTISFPNTYVNVVLGGGDNSSAPDQAMAWLNALTATTTNQVCVSDAPHAIPSVSDGAQQIITDIQAHCK